MENTFDHETRVKLDFHNKIHSEMMGIWGYAISSP